MYREFWGNLHGCRSPSNRCPSVRATRSAKIRLVLDPAGLLLGTHLSIGKIKCMESSLTSTGKSVEEPSVPTFRAAMKFIFGVIARVATQKSQPDDVPQLNGESEDAR